MVAATPVERTAEESFQIPIIYDGLDAREGYKANFLNLLGVAQVPMPVLTAKGELREAPGLPLRRKPMPVYGSIAEGVAAAVGSTVAAGSTAPDASRR
jgi:hypothetical protein